MKDKQLTTELESNDDDWIMEDDDLNSNIIKGHRV